VVWTDGLSGHVIMVQLRTKLRVRDNSGAKVLRRIQVMKTRGRHGRVGDFVVASVKKASPDSPMKKGDVVRGYLVTTVHGRSRPTGVKVRFPRNGVVMVNKKREPRATRIRSPRPSDLRRAGRMKRLMLAPHVV